MGKKVKDQNQNISVLYHALVFAVIFGTFLGIELAALGDLLPYPWDAFKFIVAAVLFSFLLFYLFFKVLGLLPDVRKFFVSIGLFIIISFQTVILWIEINRPVVLTDTKIILGFLGALIISGIVSFGAKGFWNRLLIGKKENSKRRFWLFPVSYLVLLFAGLGIYSIFVHSKPLRKEAIPVTGQEGKVLLLGIDAAYWPTLLPLIEAGELPNFERLIKEGAHGDLPSLVSMYNPFAATITHGIKSAAVWNSILSGKSPFKHGVKDFVYTQIPGFKHPFRYPLLPSFTPSRKKIMNLLHLKHRPFNSTHRKTKSAWNIYTDAGMEVGTLGFWMTWPVEEINGDLLSDRFDDPLLPMRWFPEDLVTAEAVDTVLANIHHPPQEEMDDFTTFRYDPDYETNFPAGSRKYFEHFMLYNFIKSYYHDKFRVKLGLDLMQQHSYSFLAVYIYALDTAGHAFSRFKYPELFPDVTAQEVEFFGDIIDKYHKWIDAQIGDYLQKVDDKTTIVICSDHGMGPWTGVKWEKEELQLSGSHRKNGIVILWGPNIKKGVQIYPKNLLDVFPTILYLTGLPVASDMDGSVMTSAIESDYLQNFPITRIKTYETTHYKFLSHAETEANDSYDETMLKRLKALGYLK
ncbi:alkaline phosphatase family protein [candidate division KSB1 bacterium]|nr:alkaline phosphatase family protein [candidate division KSB1 bacterium]